MTVLSNTGLQEKTVLLVEDNEAAVIQIRDMVEDMGIKMRISNSATQALKMIDQAIPDAIVLDLMMPEIDGFKILEILRNADATARVPVLILTAKQITKEELKFLKRNNIHQLIQKGDIKYEELQDAVRNMLSPKPIEPTPQNRTIQKMTHKPVVLVVEDNPDNMITVKALLSENHTVLEAINALEGIQLATVHVPDLILMDIALPDISGIEAFKRIRAIRELEHIPIIALTASAMLHNREAILSHGFDSFIAKPIIAKEFFKEIQEVLYGK
jgi:CheY-like chemotaxis protein